MRSILGENDDAIPQDRILPVKHHPADSGATDVPDVSRLRPRQGDPSHSAGASASVRRIDGPIVVSRSYVRLDLRLKGPVSYCRRYGYRW